MSSRHLLVYGTLRRSFPNKYARLLAHSGTYLGAARVRARLYNLGHFPGIRLENQGSAWVTGELYRLRTPASTLKILDRYEGSDFERVRVQAVLPDGARLWCWVYEYRNPVREGWRIASGDWLAK